jgi:hypothetical protein
MDVGAAKEPDTRLMKKLSHNVVIHSGLPKICGCQSYLGE